MKIQVDANGLRFNPNKTYTVNDTPYHGSILFDFPDAVAALGFHEIEIADLPEGVTDATHYIHYPDEAPYINWIEKPARQLAQANNADILRDIDALERQSLMPRAMREFLLSQADAAQQPWYAKVKELDDKIVALKAGLVPVPDEVVVERPE